MNKIMPVIMAGGSGSRLWPLSREMYPKQFLEVEGNMTMLQHTVQRLKELQTYSPVVICNNEHRFLVAEQLRTINKLADNIILEPVGRNTAPAIALAAFTILKNIDKDVEPIMLVLAADHIIQDEDAFVSSVMQAVTYAEQDKLVTFGIVPSHPETGYGYIRRGQAEGDDAFVVAEFVEKPDYEVACNYISSGEYYWNSGMFMFKAKSYLDELKRYRPDIYACCEAAVEHTDRDLDFVRIDEQAFSQCPAESIDYAVMEHTEHAIVVPMDAGWSDVGSWSSLWDISQKDENGNVQRGDVVQFDCRDTYVHAEDALVATLGLQNTVVVQTCDAILIADKNHVQNVKKVVEHLKAARRTEHRDHREIFRPWGSVRTLVQGPEYLVRKVVIRPEKQLTAQIHHHRAEHWTVVSGRAKVILNDREYYVEENQSTFIPAGVTHVLANPGLIPLEIIEIQSGKNLSEDDIIRVGNFVSEKK
ncbi:mannose-1-phosphate guanylyltransferase/mannose-6-phosphate isomerase [Kosakonia radicincitans]|uniref:mannose-1-phosphate guanylyltransferase/mannose-6-phosphate isomerase n=1 Tax=Kosakonia radicincitans TaxID=283686 RepID=UPI0005C58DB2|nr:mannose-1-phosphate guanylyltransferase/mannose-6-phosphate isomerase [Kosakonia radicincitans]